MRAPFPAVVKTFAALALATLLSACVHEGGTTMSNVKPGEPKLVENAYLATKDANIDIPALPVEEIPQQFRRQSVYFETAEAPGTIIINPSQRVLHYVTGKNQAIRYGISVGRAGFEWAGTAVVTEKKPWPTWTPPKEMIARDPKLAKWADGQPGGPTNPLGARAIYLTTNGVDYGYRIHGTPEWRSIGRNASSGCIRMINQDVIDLYNRLQGGEKVVVLTRDGEYPTRLILPPPQPVKKVEPVVVPAAMPTFNPMLQGVPPALQAPAATTPAAPATTAPATTTTTTTTTSG